MMRRFTRWFALLAALALAAGAGFWAGRTALRPAEVAPEVAASALTVKVTQQTVGRSLNLNVTVTQAKRPVGVNVLPGIVTAISKPRQFVTGDVLYAVSGVPVRAVVGGTPFYRDLAVKAQGPDVKQLRDTLVALALMEESGDTFTSATADAVKAWQKKLGQAETGVLRLGELVAIPKLPTSLTFDAELLQLGAQLAGGEKVVFAPTGTPTFDLVLDQRQAQLVPQTATINISHAGKKWVAVITGSDKNRNDETVMHLSAPGGGPVCANDCGSLPAGEENYLMAEVQVVPPASGAAVPVAAITTDATGQASVKVVGADGALTARPVKVLGSQDGVAVVTGVRVGEQVQVMGGDPGAAVSQPTSTPTPSR